jgi:hypothetical protein
MTSPTPTPVYKILGPNWVESSDGSSVRRTERMTVVYSEGTRQAVVEVAPGDGLAVYAQSIREWSPPHDDDPFTPLNGRTSDRCRIRDPLRTTRVTREADIRRGSFACS